MASQKEIEAIWKEFDHDFYRMAEALADERAELMKEIDTLKDEMEKHECPAI